MFQSIRFKLTLLFVATIVFPVGHIDSAYIKY
jgi:hypothetical protein